ncbi:MAG: PAS domain S-box protein [Candidatus Manganitrophus sp.]|nr:PAS domain S-box protein [Candidatus Manganitrophus sp.]MDC4225546.1 PAS domain S-box protein [Candidatus Manganitrophus sp.]WDT73096.1 MAG: PAS domain S-box protein [Candidatus Manganitrophus sp.]WDT79369.1 MAG: PAS domain S-box protein [Candidatus Manganitrophus sp.]
MNDREKTKEQLLAEIDLLRRRLAQAEETESTHRKAGLKFQRLLEVAPDGIIIVDRGGLITLVNAQAEKLFGYLREELLGQPIEILVPERFRGAHAGHRENYHTQPRTRPMGAGLDLAGRRKDGSEFPVEISLSPIETEEGARVISIVRDITDKKGAEQKLREKIREMDDFVHVVSHDLKEPLRGIEAFAGFLAEDYAHLLDEEGRRYVQFLKSSAVRMKDLIHDLLTLASISRKAPAQQKIDLNQVFRKVEEDLSYTIEQKKVRISQKHPLPTVVCDPTRMGELFKNLLSNAVKFNMSSVPEIEIDLKEEKGFYLFSVKDNGIGIDPRYQAQIFGLFERLHPQEEFEGTGAGLAICKKIVEDCGGKIWVESAPGKGSTFFFTLPQRDSR